jgi:hypothetical protein
VSGVHVDALFLFKRQLVVLRVPMDLHTRQTRALRRADGALVLGVPCGAAFAVS